MHALVRLRLQLLLARPGPRGRRTGALAIGTHLFSWVGGCGSMGLFYIMVCVCR